MNQNLRVNKTNFHMKGFALGLALKQRRNATQKSPVDNIMRGIGGKQFIVSLGGDVKASAFSSTSLFSVRRELTRMHFTCQHVGDSSVKWYCYSVAREQFLCSLVNCKIFSWLSCLCKSSSDAVNLAQFSL